MVRSLLIVATIASVVTGVLAWLVVSSPPRVKQALDLSNSPTTETVQAQDQTVVAQDLTIPWDITFLPSGEMLVTERPGRLLIIGSNKQIIQVAGVHHRGEGGLLGVVTHPDFENNHWVYLYLTTTSEGSVTNRVERYELKDAKLSNRSVIIEGIPGASTHDGGRLAFGPDKHLYIATGDASKEALAQDRDSLAGKILRVTDAGEIPKDNPFGNAVYSYGHRNVQGITWDDRGQLWSTEHGPSGLASGQDELNRIEKGKNYGWPTITGDKRQAGLLAPVIHSGDQETWAPASAAFYQGSIYFAGLRGETLYQYEISSGKLSKHIVGTYGRLRTVVAGPDGFLYITTSNTDGRGNPANDDDKILKIKPESL